LAVTCLNALIEHALSKLFVGFQLESSSAEALYVEQLLLLSHELNLWIFSLPRLGCAWVF
jgi:hypothetical protein